jgi:long-chain acyl-CoA synthetase
MTGPVVSSRYNCLGLEIPDSHDETSRILMALRMRICDVVQPWAECSPYRPALVEAEGTWTYAQLTHRIAETAVWLRSLGVRPGDRVMIIGENCRTFVAVLLAAAQLDAWPVPVSARLSAREVDEIRNHCRARRVVYLTAVSPHASAHAQRHGAVVTDAPKLGPLILGDLNEEAEPEPLDIDIRNRVASLIYTSGTTGVPKGVMLTHGNLLFAASGSAKIRGLTPDDHISGILPIAHVAGLSVGVLGALLSGATLHLSSRFDPKATLKALEADQLTVLLGAPAMYALLVEYAKLKGLQSLRLPALRIISSAGAPLHASLKSAVETLFGLMMQNAYGMTECSPNIAQTRIETPRKDTSVGPVFPGVEIKLVGPDGQCVSDGAVGELWVRGPNVMKGYYRAAQETQAVLNGDGWFNTRDLARLESGNLFIVGRSKDLIVRFGFNVHPAEVEAVLSAHPGILRCAVIGRPAQGTAGDEEVVAFIQAREKSSLTIADVAEHAARHLAPYKRPSQIVLTTAMPVTSTGKIIKDELARTAFARADGSHAPAA